MTKKKLPQECPICLQETGKTKKWKNISNHTRYSHSPSGSTGDKFKQQMELTKQKLKGITDEPTITTQETKPEQIQQIQQVQQEKAGREKLGMIRGTGKYVSNLPMSAAGLHQAEIWMDASNGRFKTIQEVINLQNKLTTDDPQKFHNPAYWTRVSEGLFENEQEVLKFWERLDELDVPNKAEVQKMIGESEKQKIVSTGSLNFQEMMNQMMQMHVMKSMDKMFSTQQPTMPMEMMRPPQQQTPS